MTTTAVRRLTASPVAATTVASMFAAAVGFAVNILMSRSVAPGVRGEVALALQFAYVFAPVVAMGLDRALLRARPDTGYSTRQMWVAGTASAVVLALAMQFSLALAVVVALVLAAIAIERAAGTPSLHYTRYLVLHFAYQSWILGASAVLAVVGNANPLVWLAVYAVPAPLIAAATRTAIARRGSAISRDNVRYLVGGLSVILAGRVDRLLLPFLDSTRTLGLYVAVSTATEMTAWVAKGLGDGRVAGLAVAAPSRRAVARMLSRDLAVFLLLSVPVGLAIKYVLLPIIGPAYANAAGYIVPLCVASALWAVFLQASALRLATRSADSSAGFDFTAAALVALLCVALVPSFGGVGAAIACAVGYFAMTVYAVASYDRDEG